AARGAGVMSATSSLAPPAAPPDVTAPLEQPAAAPARPPQPAPGREPASWTGRTGCVGYVAKMFPRISETFILDEVLALRRCAVPVRVYSIVPPAADAPIHPEAAPLVPEVQVLTRTGRGRLRAALDDAFFCLRRRPRTMLRLLYHMLRSGHFRRSWRRLERGM